MWIMKAIMSSQNKNNSSLFKETKVDNFKYGIADATKNVTKKSANTFSGLNLFVKNAFHKVVGFLTFKGMLERASHSVDETINNKKKRFNFQTGLGLLTFGAIFAGSFSVAIAADSPSISNINVMEDGIVAVAEEGQAILPDVIREAVKVLYVDMKPLVNIDTYGPESNDFVNNPNGIVQWPFWRGVPISDHFGEREAVCASGCSSTTNHGGTDFAPSPGAEVASIADGVVTSVVNFADNVLGTDDVEHSAGTHIMIRHNIDGQEVYSLYAHLQYNSIPLKVGDSVQRGQLVGKVGNTGMSTAAHLHLGIKINGKYIDAEPFLLKYNAINVPR